jgi:hypothetical protein
LECFRPPEIREYAAPEDLVTPKGKKRPRPRETRKSAPDSLKGWQQIAAFLGQPVSVAQRWAKSGMPVARQGRFVTASGEALNKWLGRESGEPLHVAKEEDDLSAELKRGLSFVRKQQKSRKD